MKKRISLMVLFMLIICIWVVEADSEEENFYEYEAEGITYKINLFEHHSGALNWINQNLPEDAVIASWWDYGHNIRAIGKRQAVAYTPSKEFWEELNGGVSEWPNVRLGDYTNSEVIKNLAIILTTTDSNQAIDLMDLYNSDYIYVDVNDYRKSWGMYKLSGVTQNGFYGKTEESSGNDVNVDSIFIKMIDKEEVDNFEMIYSDDFIVIYKVSKPIIQIVLYTLVVIFALSLVIYFVKKK